ncbi:DUF4332 domain-containing protein [Streptomyces sp. NPDC056525]|uniref:DUF4332 domain-containing protein n=1 Tax=unclassified Streptomyces TaxID=2593676 RepID=UPI0036941C9D
MWKCLARGSAAVLLTALAVVAPARAATPTASFAVTAEALCDVAEEHQKAGALDRAKDLYDEAAAKAGGAEAPCAAAGLTSVDEQRKQAAETVAAGQQLIRAGDLDKAERVFRSALAMDRNSAGAAAGIAQVDNAQGRTDASSNWDRFYESWVEPLGKLLLFSAAGLVILYALAGLSSRIFVRVDAVAWPPAHRWIAGTFGFLLIFGAAVMLPLYAMFEPFSAQGSLTGWASGAVLVIGLGMILLVVLAANSKHSHRRNQGDWSSWSALLLTLGVVVLVAGALLLTPREPLGAEAAGVFMMLGLMVVVSLALVSTRPKGDWPRKLALLFPLGLAVLLSWSLLRVPLQDEGRVMAAYVVLAVIGVVLTAATLGQNLRLQVEVQTSDGAVSAGSTDYLLARMKGLGTESPKALHRATSVLATTPLSKITSEDLSALPAGKVAGAMSRLVFALRPDLTWHARVTLVDEDRVAMTLSRNGRHVESDIFSRPDLGLPAIPTGLEEADRTVAQDRARAQLLTGAAAFILLRLSQAHLELQDDLYDAERWQSVALQVIATSRSLINDGEDRSAERVELLSRAVEIDPGYALARFEYMWAVYGRIPDEETDHAAFAKSLDDEYERSRLDEKSERKDEGWAPLRIRVKYSSATQWLNGYVTRAHGEKKLSDQEKEDLLGEAENAVEALKRLCNAEWRGSMRLRQQALRMRDFAENLEHCIEALRGVRPQQGAAWLHPHAEHNPSPRLTWDHACLDCFLAGIDGLEAERGMRLGQAIEDLEFAAATDKDRSAAADDPCFRQLASEHRFRKLVGTVPPTDFLSLPMLDPHRIPLAKLSIHSALDLVRRTRSAEQQEQLADHLGVSRVVVDQMREVALLAQVHPDLDDPGMLHLLVAEGVSSPEALRDRATRKPRQLIHQLRHQAEQSGPAPRALGWPRCWRWLFAARR